MTLTKSIFAVAVALTLAACEMPAHDDAAARHAEGGGMMNDGEVMMGGGEVMLGDDSTTMSN